MSVGPLAAIVVGGVVAWPVLKGLIALKSRQTVYHLAPESHQKKQGTPTMGGIIILIGWLAGIMTATQDWGLCLWVLGFAFIGFADDFVVPKLIKGKRGLGWKQKIVAQLVMAVLAVPAFHLARLPWTVGGSPAFGQWNPWVVGLTVLIVLFYSNAYNFADGLDGLAGSLGLLLCLGLWLLAPPSGFSPARMGLECLAAAIVPFLVLNVPPAKVFMGDVGSLPIGAFLGGSVAAALFVLPPVSQVRNVSSITILSIVMIAELVPVPLQVGYYKLTKKRLFPMTPIHHAFEVKGWPEKRVVLSFIAAQVVFVILAFAISSRTRYLLFPSGPTPVDRRADTGMAHRSADHLAELIR